MEAVSLALIPLPRSEFDVLHRKGERKMDEIDVLVLLVALEHFSDHVASYPAAAK